MTNLDLHLRIKCHKKLKQNRSLCEDIEFSAEDAGRSDPAFMAEIFGEVE